MDFLPKHINSYSETHTQDESELLQELNRETHLKILYPRMLSGHFQGRLLSFFANMIRPSRILEVGTYTGYATICLAEGLAQHGKIVSLEKDAELEYIARKYWKTAKIEDKIELHIGNALEIIPTLNEEWDLVFLDADKENYENYYHLILPQLRVGGIILADNVLWSGKVTDIQTYSDKDTKSIDRFNKMVKEDPSVECVLLPVRDGIMMIRKLKNNDE